MKQLFQKFGWRIIYLPVAILLVLTYFYFPRPTNPQKKADEIREIWETHPPKEELLLLSFHAKDSTLTFHDQKDSVFTFKDKRDRNNWVFCKNMLQSQSDSFFFEADFGLLNIVFDSESKEFEFHQFRLMDGQTLPDFANTQKELGISSQEKLAIYPQFQLRGKSIAPIPLSHQGKTFQLFHIEETVATKFQESLGFKPGWIPELTCFIFYNENGDLDLYYSQKKSASFSPQALVDSLRNHSPS